MLTPALLIVLSFAVAFGGAWLLAGRVGDHGTRRLRARLAAVRHESAEDAKPALLLREKYLRQFSPLERRLEELPGMPALARRIEQSGAHTPAYRLMLHCLMAAAFGALLGAALDFGWLTPLLALAAGGVPLLRLELARRRRFEEFERELPTALDLMGRALRAGTPLTEAFKFVGDEMQGPIAEEFRTTWSHINYGIPLKASLAEMTQRMPCLSLRALATAMLVQRETGGNLTEILDAIAAVLRSRFRFQRRLKTLTAEGRMSAWVLTLMPFALALILSATSPDYLPLLLDDPTGRNLVWTALGLMALGVLWVRSTIKVRV